MSAVNKKGKNKISIVLYVVSVLVGIYTLFTVYTSYTYISGLVANGLVISDELSNVISYYVQASSPYLFYTIVIWAIGYIINKLDTISYEIKTSNNTEIEEDFIITEEVAIENIDNEEIREEASEGDQNKEI